MEHVEQDYDHKYHIFWLKCSAAPSLLLSRWTVLFERMTFILRNGAKMFIFYDSCIYFFSCVSWKEWQVFKGKPFQQCLCVNIDNYSPYLMAP